MKLATAASCREASVGRRSGTHLEPVNGLDDERIARGYTIGGGA
jgi:hypothetical protein